MTTLRYLTDRAETAGLRALADIIESDPEIALPGGVKPSWHFHGEDAKERAREIMRKLAAGRWDKDEWDTSLILEGWIHGVPVDLWIDREQVCERVVVGVDTVTEEVRIGEDPRPVETVTREVERVEWVCGSLLDASGEVA